MDASFVHLRGIHTLDMRYCSQITDTIFAYLRGIHTFYVGEVPFHDKVNRIHLVAEAYARLKGREGYVKMMACPLVLYCHPPLSLNPT